MHKKLKNLWNLEKQKSLYSKSQLKLTFWDKLFIYYKKLF